MGSAVPSGLLTHPRVFFTHRTKIEKEKKEHAKLHGMIRTEISGAEIAEEMEKERRFFQLQMCEVRGQEGEGSTAGPWVHTSSPAWSSPPDNRTAFLGRKFVSVEES